MRWYWHQYLGAQTVFDPPYLVGPAPRADTHAGPAAGGDRDGRAGSLTPARAVTYARRLRHAGVPVVHRDFRGLFHGFMTIQAFPPAVGAASICGSARVAASGTGRGVVTPVTTTCRRRRRVRRAVRRAPARRRRLLGAGHRGRRRRRRHLVLEPLPGRALRRRKRRLLLLLRRRPPAGVDVDRALRRTARDPAPTSSTSPIASSWAGTTSSRPRSPAPPSTPLSGTWEVHTSTGARHRADYLVCATGCLSAVNRPDIPGIDGFSGEVYYTAAWPEEPPSSAASGSPDRHRILGNPGDASAGRERRRR